MKNRKIILLSTIALLLCVYVVQLATSSRGAVRDMKLTDNPDTIVIAQGGVTLTLSQENGEWVVGDRKYPADSAAAKDIVSALADLRVLETVAKTSDAGALDRYGLEPEKTITAKALKGDKELRAIVVGKDASTASQTYLTLDGGRDIYLVSGSLRNVLGKNATELRSLSVYNLKYEDLSAVKVNSPTGRWALQKSGDPPAWSLVSGTEARPAGAVVAVDADKAAAWVKGIASLNAEAWLGDDAALPATRPTTLTITVSGAAVGAASGAASGKDVTVAIYPSGAGKDLKYLCTSSATPYKFTLSAYSAEQFMKKPADLKK